MSILSPSTTPQTEQVWPALPKPGKPEIVRIPREQRKPVTFDDIKVGDTLSFLAERRGNLGRLVAREGTVIKKSDRVAMVKAHEGGVHVLTTLNWQQRAPRR